ncbi:MAG: glutamyl-tRNA reductase [Chitinophagaceae bacterium]|nr:glutamyl-tRNA reductase [Chitinophagaceae bacterium]
MPNNKRDITNFFIAGINYKKTDALLRGEYAINNEQYACLLEQAKLVGMNELFVISTCNRTEIYGFTDSAETLMQLLCSQTQGSLETFTQIAYIKKGIEAIEHLFEVGAGLDSQILGDYEIVGQLKQAVKFSKERDFIGAYMERLINGVLQTSKEIRTKTELSGGTVSVSFAAIQYIKEKISHISKKRILLIGTGKIGRNTCKNLVDYLNTKNIMLINRTEGKAVELAEELGLMHAPVEQLDEQIQLADIILVATNSAEPIIIKDHLENSSTKLIIDLSIPYNVEEAAQQLPHITLVNVDELSKIKDATLEKRKAEIPKVKSIIATHIAEFAEWHQMRQHVPMLKEVKSKLQAMNNCQMYIAYTASQVHHAKETSSGEKIQKVLNGMAVKMRTQNQRGCYYLEAINEFIATGTN